MELIQSIDFQILDFLQEHVRNAFLDPIMAGLSYMGEAMNRPTAVSETL